MTDRDDTVARAVRYYPETVEVHVRDPRDPGRPGRPDGRGKPAYVVRKQGDAKPVSKIPPRPGEARREAEALVAAGFPPQMAMAIALRKMTKNEALERLAKRDDVERLMKQHDLSRALATQVVLGHADLEAFLAKRRFEQHRAEHQDRSCLDRAVAGGQVLTLALTEHRRVEAKVLAVTAYHATIQEEGKDPVEVHKLDLKYAYAPDDWKKLKKVLKKDKDLADATRRPSERPQDRYTCSDRRLFRYLDEKIDVDVTLLEGEELHGQVVWFSRFEFGLGLKGGGEVTIFRHALHRIGEEK